MGLGTTVSFYPSKASGGVFSLQYPSRFSGFNEEELEEAIVNVIDVLSFQVASFFDNAFASPDKADTTATYVIPSLLTGSRLGLYSLQKEPPVAFMIQLDQMDHNVANATALISKGNLVGEVELVYGNSTDPSECNQIQQQLEEEIGKILVTNEFFGELDPKLEQRVLERFTESQAGVGQIHRSI